MDVERNHHGGPWRCFHCDDVFTTVGAASDHFGPHPAATPGCVIDKILPEGGTNTQRGLGLLMALRKAEAELARYREEDTDLHRELHRRDSEHRLALQREEEKGYARGLRDGVNLPADSPERASIAGVTAAPAPSEHARAALALVGYLRSQDAKQRDKAADDLVRHIDALERAALGVDEVPRG